jgi:hypothetical protein
MGAPSARYFLVSPSDDEPESKLLGVRRGERVTKTRGMLSRHTPAYRVLPNTNRKHAIARRGALVHEANSEHFLLNATNNCFTNA